MTARLVFAGTTGTRSIPEAFVPRAGRFHWFRRFRGTRADLGYRCLFKPAVLFTLDQSPTRDNRK